MGVSDSKKWKGKSLAKESVSDVRDHVSNVNFVRSHVDFYFWKKYIVDGKSAMKKEDGEERNAASMQSGWGKDNLSPRSKQIPHFFNKNDCGVHECKWRRIDRNIHIRMKIIIK